MAEENQNGLSEAAEKSVNTAQAIRGAVKAGKAIAAASKGAAAGGPYGAVAGALWANRKQVGKIIIVLVALLMVPLIIIAMLPAMIFSTIGGLFGGADTEAPMTMNDTAAIIRNIETVGSSLNQMMLEALDDLYARIDRDFAASSGDWKEINNPYEGSNIIDANLIISQFCAAKSIDIDSISLAELERTVREHKGALFSFTKRAEVYIYTVTDPITGEETTYTETVIYYTVVYSGNTHFAEAICCKGCFRKTPLLQRGSHVIRSKKTRHSQ